MSTYWKLKNAQYKLIYVIEDIQTGVQETHEMQLLLVDGKASLLGVDSAIGSHRDIEIKNGSELISSLPAGYKVISVDSSGLPSDIATVSYEDGTTENPGVGIRSGAATSTGTGIDSTTASTQSAPN